MQYRGITGYILTALVFSLIVPVGTLNAYAAGPPVVNDDSATTNQAIPVIIDIISNDVNTGRAYTVNLVTPPAHGILSNPLLNSDGKVVYTPGLLFSGTDSFQYTITSSGGTSNVGTVTITVNPVLVTNLPPITVPDVFTVPENTPSIQLDVLANDHDPENDPLTIETAGGPQHGAVSVTSDQKFVTYQPFSGYSGPDSFTYTITDGHTHGIVGSASVTITKINTAPTADILNFPALQNNPANIILTGSDQENDPLTFSVDNQPSHGTLSGIAPNLTYTPNLNYVGNDIFKFHTNDGSLNSNSANVTMHVMPFGVNITTTTSSGITNISSQTISGTGNSGAFVTVYSGNTIIGTTIVHSDGTWSTPTTLFEGYNVITAKENDSQGHVSLASASITITLDTINPLVAISAPSNNAIFNTSTITVTGTASDNLGTGINQVTVSINNGAQNVATLSGNNWSFSIPNLSDGTYTIIATATDKAGNTANTSITITVDTTKPVVVISSPSNGALLNNLSTAVTGTASDNPGTGINQVTVSINNGAQNVATLSGNNWSFSASSLVVGSNVITATATDKAGNTANTSITITVGVNTPIITTPSATTSNPSQSITGTAAPNSIVNVYSGATLLGTVTADASGNWSITATLATGANTITATSTIGSITSPPSNSITITVGVNTPIITTPSATTSNPSQSITGTAAPNSIVNVYSGATLLGTVTADASGNWSITATLATGANTITATSTIGSITSPPSNSITITVGVNTPIITTPSATTSNPSQSITGTAAPNSIVNVYSGATLLGTVTADASGNWSITATLATGANTITATSTIGSITSPPSNSITITVGVNTPIITTPSATTSNPSQSITGTADS